MPVTFRIDDASGAILTTARGIISYAELAEHIVAKHQQGLMTRPELFDARDTNLDLSLSELHQIAESTKKALGPDAPSKIAVVTNSAFVYGLARAYAALSREDNPQFQIFQTFEAALDWLSATRKT